MNNMMLRILFNRMKNSVQGSLKKSEEREVEVFQVLFEMKNSQDSDLFFVAYEKGADNRKFRNRVNKDMQFYEFFQSQVEKELSEKNIKTWTNAVSMWNFETCEIYNAIMNETQVLAETKYKL